MINKYMSLNTSWFELTPASVLDKRQSGEQSSPTSQQQSATKSPSQGEQKGSPEQGGSGGDSASTGEETASDLPLDQVFEILKNRRRRLVLHYLEEHDGESSLSDLAEHIAAIENDTTIKAISSTQRKRVYVGLYQCHLPKMDDMNIIDFDQNRGTVVLSQNADQVRSYLGEPDERAWHKMYLGLSLSGAALFLVAEAGASQYGLSSAVVLLFLILGITSVGLAQTYDLGEVLPDAVS